MEGCSRAFERGGVKAVDDQSRSGQVLSCGTGGPLNSFCLFIIVLFTN